LFSNHCLAACRQAGRHDPIFVGTLGYGDGHLTASILYHHGKPLANIQAILRHRSPKTTERYLKSIGLERVREALEGLSNKSGKADVISFDRTQETSELEVQEGKAV